ncbi:hypothetical protein ACS0TY_018473 [Phlomoides rotata]
MIGVGHLDSVQYETRRDEKFKSFPEEIQSTALEVPSATPEVKINALTNDLMDRDLYSSLAKKLVQTFDELLKMAEKYVTLEEVKRAKKVETKSSATEKKKEWVPKWPGPDQSKGAGSRP